MAKKEIIEGQEPKKEAKKQVPMKLYQEFGELYKTKLFSKPGSFKKEKELKELGDEVLKYDGLKPKKQGEKETYTLNHRGVTLFLVKGFPVPAEFTSLFKEELRKVYFE